MISRRWFYWALVLGLAAGLVWGAIFGRYVGYQAGALEANKAWLKAVTQMLLKMPVPENPACNPMPSYNWDMGPKVVNDERVQALS
jgi:hypothetical protein